MKNNRSHSVIAHSGPLAEFDRILEQVHRPLSERPSDSGGVSTPSADCYADSENHYLRVELPGVKKDAVSLQFHDRLLSVEGKREASKPGPAKAVHFRRSFCIPEEVEVDRISGQLEDGILQVTLPKSSKGRARKIEIR